MRKVGTLTLSRAVLAVAAVLVVAIPSFVYAAGPVIPGYPAPLYAVIVGQGSVSLGNSTTPYELFVEFVDGTNTTLTAPNVVFSANVGTMNTASGVYTAPVSSPNPPRALLHATATFSSGSVLASRVILLQ